MTPDPAGPDREAEVEALVRLWEARDRRLAWIRLGFSLAKWPLAFSLVLALGIEFTWIPSEGSPGWTGWGGILLASLPLLALLTRLERSLQWAPRVWLQDTTLEISKLRSLGASPSILDSGPADSGNLRLCLPASELRFRTRPFSFYGEPRVLVRVFILDRPGPWFALSPQDADRMSTWVERSSSPGELESPTQTQGDPCNLD